MLPEVAALIVHCASPLACNNSCWSTGAILRMYKDSGLDSKGIKEMMNQADTDGDGEIDVDEFKVRVVWQREWCGREAGG